MIQKLALKGDPEAFTEIINRYAGLVYSVCYRILRDRERARDAAQDTFYRLLQSPTRSLSGWLHKAATRTAIDIVRKDSSRQKREIDYTMTPIKASQWKDISHYIDAVLISMGEESRMFLIQHFLQGKRQEEIAAELEISQATVSRKIKAGIEELKKGLKKKGIVVGSALLGTLLLSGISEAAPLALLNELGKMDMFNKISNPLYPKKVKRVFNFRRAVLTGIAMVIIAILPFSSLKYKETESTGILKTKVTTKCAEAPKINEDKKSLTCGNIERVSGNKEDGSYYVPCTTSVCSLTRIVDPITGDIATRSRTILTITSNVARPKGETPTFIPDKILAKSSPLKTIRDSSKGEEEIEIVCWGNGPPSRIIRVDTLRSSDGSVYVDSSGHTETEIYKLYKKEQDKLTNELTKSRGHYIIK
ncbi:MAG: sigma-70 family RNA polymerase sigma factor [bacterium]|nr:sigma-70 family RNA polymerase sigma factor [bacterium]